MTRQRQHFSPPSRTLLQYALHACFAVRARTAGSYTCLLLQLVQDLRLNRNPTLSDTALRGLHRAPPPDDPFIHRTAESSKTSDGGKGEEEASSGGHEDAQLDIDGHDAHAGMDDWFYSGAATDSKGDKSAHLPLVCLDLSGCTGITDVGFRHLAQACSNLQQLRLQLCDQPGLTAAGIASIAECMPSLVSLDLSGCRQVTSDTIVAIATGCPHLRSILLVRTVALCPTWLRLTRALIHSLAACKSAMLPCQPLHSTAHSLSTWI